jgi:hypothetical protein
MAELLTGFNGKRIFAERASQDSAGDCIRTTYLKKSDLVSVQSDWEETDPASLQYILNKPDLSNYATVSYVNTELGKKPDRVEMETELAKKPDRTEMDAALARKPDRGEVVEIIAVDGTDLAMDDHYRVNIPLAASSTPGQSGDAGVMRGIYEEF